MEELITRPPKADPDDVVVVIHGFAGSRLWMLPLCWRLRSRGYRVVNWGYPSLRGNVATHAARLHDYLSESLFRERCVHLVAHSMGAIVVRAALSMGPAANLGRVVLLSPPNRGTPIARWAAPLLGRLCQGIADLSDHMGSTVCRLPVGCPTGVGILAARFDLLVPIASTHLTGASDHLVLNASHNSLLLTRTPARLVVTFLETGRFETGCRRLLGGAAD